MPYTPSAFKRHPCSFAEAMASGMYRGLVTEVHDGDTITVQIDVGFYNYPYERLRVKGVNAPELSTEFGPKAQQFVRWHVDRTPFVLLRTERAPTTGGERMTFERFVGDVLLVSVEHGARKMEDLSGLLLRSKNAIPYP